jgi:hypothetical protein
VQLDTSAVEERASSSIFCIPNARLKEIPVSETTKMAVKQKTVSLSSTTPPPKQRSTTGAYQLHNDTNSHVSVFRQESDVPQGLFVLAPGATSDSYSWGYEIYILYVESGASTPLTWNGWNSITIAYHACGYPAHQGVNNVSSI